MSERAVPNKSSAQSGSSLKTFFTAGISRPKNDRQAGADAPMVVIILIMLVFGIIMMFSAGYAYAIAEGLEGDYYFKRQSMMAAVGLVFMFIISFIDYHFLQKQWVVTFAYIGSLIMLLLCFVPGLRSNRGAHRWIVLGTFEFQPSEIAKIAIILLFAYWVSINYSNMKKFTVGIIPFLVALGIYAVILVAQPHYSATIITVAICLSLMLIGGSDIKHLAIVGALFLGVIALYMFYQSATGQLTYIEDRIHSFVDPFDEEYWEDTYQTRNSLIAIGSGGLFGLGLGNSRQKFLYLPDSKNDFIFAIICEELGFVGAVMVILLFILFIIRGFTIAVRAVDKSGMLIACGITIQIGLQAFLNMGVACNAIPNTGISLPFLSYGGTALILQLCEMGILLNISRHTISEPTRRQRMKRKEKRRREQESSEENI